MLPLKENVKCFVKAVHNFADVLDAPAHKEIDAFTVNHIAIADHARIGNQANNALLCLVMAHLGPEYSDLSCGAIVDAGAIKKGKDNIGAQNCLSVCIKNKLCGDGVRPY